MKYYGVVIFLFLLGCENSEFNMKEQRSTIELALHVPIQHILNVNAGSFSQECMPGLDMCWYKMARSFNSKVLPDAIIKSPAGDLSIPNVTLVTIAVDERVGTDVENIDIVIRGLPDNSTHEQNRDFIYDVIDNIKRSGWRRYYAPGHPRISGSQSNKIASAKNVLGYYVSSYPWLDPDYKTDMERWLKFDYFHNWHFYKEGIYLHLKAWRRNSQETPALTGTYLITMAFKTERERWVSEFSEDEDRARWKELLPARLKDYREKRHLIEEQARARGIDIDEAYQDPPIHALTPAVHP